MKTETIKEAIIEAERFIKAAKKCVEAREIGENSGWHSNYPRESGSTRRASMDLTRKLAEMRKP